MLIASPEIIIGDCREVLRAMATASVHCVVTSPPYFQQRDYKVAGQIGREDTPQAFIAGLVDVFRQVRRVLVNNGTLWLNLGDSRRGKSLMGLPWRVALALGEDGWIIRQDIIWHKLRPMPDGAKDRPSAAHEYVFLLTKQERYFYDADAVAETASPNSHGGKAHNPGSKALASGNHKGGSLGLVRADGLRNRRSVWSISGTPFPGAHCAPFPSELVEPCIAAGCPPDGVVLDPFAGSLTTGLVAVRLGRKSILIELNPDHVATGNQRFVS